VWFRASTQGQAAQLNITGSAQNLTDGSVEVVACGEAAALEALREWLWRGPELAQVTDVECESLQADMPSGFTTG
jgi:acylphosphatase